MYSIIQTKIKTNIYIYIKYYHIKIINMFKLLNKSSQIDQGVFGLGLYIN